MESRALGNQGMAEPDSVREASGWRQWLSSGESVEFLCFRTGTFCPFRHTRGNNFAVSLGAPR
jgi:hypothetical protein